MSKVIRVVAQVAAIVVNVIPGLGQLASASISIGLAVGSSLLSPRPKTPVNSAESVNRLRASIDPRAPRKTVIGITGMQADLL